MYPTGILLNKKTGRFHTISFRVSPRPSESLTDGACRYRSIGHHTVGFATQVEAEAFIEEHKKDGSIATGLVWEWDGEGLPSMMPTLPYPYPEVAL